MRQPEVLGVAGVGAGFWGKGLAGSASGPAKDTTSKL